MARPKSFETLLKEKKQEFAQYYDIEHIDSPNDKQNIDTFLRNQILIEQYQTRLSSLSDEEIFANVTEIAKIQAALSTMTKNNMELEKQLGIDRKSRKNESSKDNPAEYILNLKQAARNFLEKRLQKMYCPECQVMVMRFSPVHDHTQFKIEIQCSQCKKKVIAERKEKDIFYKLRASDREWRRKHPIEIVQPKKSKVDFDEIDLVIGSDEEMEENGD